MLLALLLALLPAAPADSARPELTPAQVAEETERWMSDYVRWIAADAEREAYAALDSVEQRLAFIEAFWVRRDPTPGTPENEARDQHLRRFAHAARHFGAGKPGYLTDRGQAYILLGAPHGRQSNPTGRRAGERPSEIWTYNNLPGQRLDASLDLHFVDFSGAGDYRLVSNLDLAAVVRPQGRAPASSELIALAQQRALGQVVDPISGASRPLDPTQLIAEQFDLMRDLRAIDRLALEGLPALDQTTAAIRTQLAFAAPLALQAKPEFFLGTAGQTAVVASGAVRFDDLQPRPFEQLQIVSLDLLARLLDPAGTAVASASDRLTLKLAEPEYRQRLGRELRFQLRLSAAPGSYRFELIARDNVGARVGVVEQPVELPALDGERLTLSSLSLADSIEPAPDRAEQGEPFRWGELRVLPNPAARFAVGQTVHAYLHAYHLAREPESGLHRLEVRFVIERDGAAAAQPPALYPAPTSETRRAIAAAVPTARLAPGDYVLRATVTDQVSGEQASASAPFTLGGN